MPRRLLIYGALLYVVLAWSINHIVAKQVISQMDPLAFTFLRFLIMTPLVFVMVFASGRHLHIERRDIPTLLLCSACGFGVYQYLWVLGLARTTPFATALLGATTPIFTLAIVAIAGLERVRPGRWGGAVIALLGVAIFEGAFSGSAGVRVGDLLILAAAMVFAGYNVLGSRLLARYSSLELLALTLPLGTLVLIPGGAPALLHTNLHAFGWDMWWRIGYATLFPILLTYPVWIWGINKLGAGKGSIIAFSLARIYRRLERTDPARVVPIARSDRRSRLSWRHASRDCVRPRYPNRSPNSSSIGSADPRVTNAIGTPCAEPIAWLG